MSKHDECCSDKCSSGLRNNYFEGKRITAHSFNVEQKYMIGRRRLINRAVHGWGVVYGYGIKINEDKSVTIGAGLALDEHGRELVLIDSTNGLKDVMRLDGCKASSLEKLEDNEAGGKWVLSVHYAERSLESVKVNDPCECERDQWDRTCETVQFFLRKADKKYNCCPDDFEDVLTCECAKGGCCEEAPVRDRTESAGQDTRDYGSDAVQSEVTDEYSQEAREDDADRAAQVIPREPGRGGVKRNPHEDPPPKKTYKRGGCECLCHHLTYKFKPSGDGDDLCKIEEACGEVWADLKHGVDLACVSLVKGNCNWTFGELEACGPRRLVKRNDLLFDLIQGRDLTYISDIGWADWHRSTKLMPFDLFDKALKTGKPSVAGDSDKGVEAGYEGAVQDKFESQDVTETPPRFRVMFSRPVLAETLRRDCFAMTILIPEKEGGWWTTLRVPIVSIDKIKDPKDPSDTYAIGAEIEFLSSWLEDAIRGTSVQFTGSRARVEIEIRGDFIVDCNGQTVDANASGVKGVPTGNGTPGGTFLSVFRLDVKPEEKKQQYDGVDY